MLFSSISVDVDSDPIDMIARYIGREERRRRWV
jgi:hypothetical protein